MAEASQLDATQAKARTSPSPFAPYRLAEARYDAQRCQAGRDWGLPGLAEEGFHIHPGITVIAARPSDGKTLIMLNGALHHAEQDPGAYPGPSVFVSYEESRMRLYMRALARTVALERVADGKEPGAPSRQVIQAFLAGTAVVNARTRSRIEELERASGHVDRLVESGRLILVDGDDGRGHIDCLLADLAAHESSTGQRPGLLTLDYFQKIKPARDSEKGATRQQRLADVSDRLRTYTKGARAWGRNVLGPSPEREVPLVVGAQITRRDKSKKTEPQQPEADDIRECDDLLNDAVALFTLFHFGGALRVKCCKDRNGKRDWAIKWGFFGSCNLVLPHRRDDGNG